MAIILCGDTHGMIDMDKVIKFFDEDSVKKEYTKKDYLIILGDVGILWDDGAYDREVQNVFNNLPVTVL